MACFKKLICKLLLASVRRSLWLDLSCKKCVSMCWSCLGYRCLSGHTMWTSTASCAWCSGRCCVAACAYSRSLSMLPPSSRWGSLPTFCAIVQKLPWLMISLLSMPKQSNNFVQWVLAIHGWHPNFFLPWKLFWKWTMAAWICCQEHQRKICLFRLSYCHFKSFSYFCKVKQNQKEKG